MPHKPASPALSRFTVLDLTRVRSGPTCVRQLADWGANVIKIELPEALDAGEGLGGSRHGPDFQNLHRNKRSHCSRSWSRRRTWWSRTTART
jgi:formyl-CoA transferase